MISLNGKRVLLTGPKGFIGSHLLRRLLRETGAEVVALSRSGCGEKTDGIKWVNAPLEGLVRGTWETAGIKKFDIVIHIGGFTPKTSKDADNTGAIFRDNLIGTRSLFESLPEPPEKIVFASTLDVYGPPMDGRVIDEDTPVSPSGLYGASKLFCESLVRAHAKGCGCGYAVLRLGHIFGPGEEAYQKFIPQSIRALLRGEPPAVYGDGSAQRDYLYVSDAVEAALRATASDEKAIGPVNIVRGSSTTLLEAAETLVRISGFSGRPRLITDKPAGYSMRLDNSRMLKSLGKWDFVPLEEGLRLEWESMKKVLA
ncbi:MAG: NAD(P)-dependent oxidoreductase [Deltaproteobacteria bacterium]|nr:NAD(P)-dependent oxidoreductase [Deltaproteobacteria bacterium]